MKNLVYLFLGFTLFLSSCGGDESDENTEEQSTSEYKVDPEEFMLDFNEMNQKIDANLENPDQELLKEAVTMYQDYAGIFPENSDAPDYLHKAADFAYATKQVSKSVKPPKCPLSPAPP